MPDVGRRHADPSHKDVALLSAVLALILAFAATRYPCFGRRRGSHPA